MRLVASYGVAMTPSSGSSVPRPHGFVLPPGAMARRTAFRLLAAAVVFSVGGALQDETMSYSCCKPLLLRFNPERRNLWSHNNTNFALSMNGQSVCTAPCKNIKQEVMELEECVDVRLQETWEQMDFAMERRIHHVPQPCAASAAGNPGVASVLLLVLITMIKMIC